MLNCGIDNIKSQDALLKGARIGLITNPTGLDKKFKSTIDILNENYNLVCMFSPEHGVRGDLQAGDHVETYTDSKTNLPVYSLYGSSPHMKIEILDTIDIIVFDIQDVGARFYTYLYTLAYAMEDCKKAGKRVVVLDRINPISANKVEGTI
ncbi:MAG: exo-beta-N-acetylmuramidase NamZ domain-containing protein, partial [Oscillospiraceae bacterium]